ncbi:MAG: GH116 family glycosyl-hydrolase [Isosphaeraceae bacterium]
MNPNPGGCESGSCYCGPSSLPRREFLALSGLGLAGLFSAGEAVAGPFDGKEYESLIPADKKFKPEWLAQLTARGKPETYSDGELRFIGMPVGGICCGTLYLSGDGRLWLWNIFNKDVEGIDPKTVTYAGQRLQSRDGSAYVAPPQPMGPVAQGFWLRVRSAGVEKTVTLDRDGFREVTFLGQYPIGTVTYRDPDVPVSARLEAYSPFTPLDADDSGLPATVMSYTLTNNSPAEVEVTIAGWLENAVGLDHRDLPGTRRNRIIDEPSFTFLESSAAKPDKVDEPPPRPDVVFEDWTRDTYEGWTVEGVAFGRGPVLKAAMPAYQGDVGGPGVRVVNSHATAPGNGIGAKDDQTGQLTSRPFTVDRNYIRLWIGGGDYRGDTCVNLRVEGKVVRSITGRQDNRMREESLNARPWLGKPAVVEIVDARAGGWGNIGVGRITFSDVPVVSGPFEELPDVGTMGLALLGRRADDRVAGAEREGIGGKPGDSAEVPLDARLVGSIGRTLNLKPGESSTVDFLVAWHFPNLTLAGQLKGRYYASRFPSASAVVRYVAGNFDRLSAVTKHWRDTWYDSTLPYWFLNRTFANTSVLATTTCYRLADGRFWAWEGVGCCPGTCTHVWHYAQAMGRIFPELERDLRERVDFGLSLDARTGVIRYRGEYGDTFAVDGQCGTILRAYREHQMSPDDRFLKRLWPRIKRAMQCVIDRDADGSGVLYGPMHNTLDADWYGVVPWLVGLYHAALRAGEAMAREVGDEAFARTCRARLEKGIGNLDKLTWREDKGYYVHVGDPKHLNEVGSYDGCEIDQVFGQSWAWQVGLGRVMDEAHVKQALRSLWRYSVTPDVGPYRRENRAGRWYAMPGDGGLVMVTFPFGRPPQVSGPGAWSAMYFNECMSGFEWQVASHMIWEGMVTEGLAVARLIYDRYHPRLRNPYNEVECSDHYARSMASYGAFLAACGFECHGPKGHIGFTPRLGPDDFRSAFTAAEGWGTYEQRRMDGQLKATLRLRHGQVRLRSFAVGLPVGNKAGSVRVETNGKPVAATLVQNGPRVVVAFGDEVRVPAGQSIELTVQYAG